MRAAEVGWEVVGLDVDPGRVERLRDGDSFVEDVPAAQLRAALASGCYRPTTDGGEAAGFDVAVLTVPTPLREGIPDLTHIEEASRALAGHLRPGALVVLESTTYPGTTEELVRPLLEAGSGLVAGRDFSLGYSPERIDPGNATWTLIRTPKVVSGVDPGSLECVRDFYGSLVDEVVPVSSTRSAELAKLLENTFRHVNVALVNELAVFAHALGVDVWEAIDAAATKPFGFMRFTPGPGVGGHCLPIDPSYLSWQVKRVLGQPFRFVELANDVNDRMPDYVARRVVGLLNWDRKAVNGSRILVLGLAYKRNTGDARESPAVRAAQALGALGGDVRAVDDLVDPAHLPAGLPLVALTRAELAASDLVVVLTDHDHLDWQLVVDSGVRVLDTRNRIRGARVTAL